MLRVVIRLEHHEMGSKGAAHLMGMGNSLAGADAGTTECHSRMAKKRHFWGDPPAALLPGSPQIIPDAQGERSNFYSRQCSFELTRGEALHRLYVRSPKAPGSWLAGEGAPSNFSTKFRWGRIASLYLCSHC